MYNGSYEERIATSAKRKKKDIQETWLEAPIVDIVKNGI